ncbi:MAG TPA: tetratricopeptide repeat protein, partial [Candidatus Udaeobacter sp.]
MNTRENSSASVPACETVPPRKRDRSRYIVDACCAMILLGVVSSAFGQSDAEFAKANQEFAQGRFKEAIAGYEALVHEGQWNANLFYDLGNAYFRTRDFGRAILNYERALAL